MLLTTVHHSYGAIIYNTPWRHHVAIVGVVTVLFASLRVHRSLAGNLAGKIASWLFAIVTLLIPVAGIGVYEGGYNHGLKDVLYFSGASVELMNRLFPAPTYEMPNDAFFEITGWLQFPLAQIHGGELVRAIRLARKVLIGEMCAVGGVNPLTSIHGGRPCNREFRDSMPPFSVSGNPALHRGCMGVCRCRFLYARSGVITWPTA